MGLFLVFTNLINNACVFYRIGDSTINKSDENKEPPKVNESVKKSRRKPG